MLLSIKLEIFYRVGGVRNRMKSMLDAGWVFLLHLERFVQHQARLCDFTICCLGKGRYSENPGSVWEEAVQEHWEQH